MNIKYLIGLWILTTLLAPFVFSGYELLFEVPGKVISPIEIYPVMIIFTALFSLPTVISAIVIIKLNKNFGLKNMTLKILIWILWLTGIVLSLQLLGGSIIPALTISFIAAAIISVLIIEIRTKIGAKTNANTA